MAEDKVFYVAMSQWLGYYIPNPRVWSLKALRAFKVDLAFYAFEVNQMSTNNSWDLVVKTLRQ